jgi:hypothetical protein
MLCYAGMFYLSHRISLRSKMICRLRTGWAH